VEVYLFYTSHQAGQLVLTTVLYNGGVMDVLQPFTMTFRVGDPTTGTLAGTAQVNNSVPAGGAITLTHMLTDLEPLVGQGDKLWAVADDERVIVEVDDGNNSAYAAFGVLPDLTLGTDIQGSGPVTVTVHNQGLYTATNVLLTVYQDGLTGPLVYSSTRGTLAVGDAWAVPFMPPTGQIELWAQVDPDHAVAELDEGNNLAVRSVGKTTYRIYLPVVLKFGRDS
jgi:subtilase family serine protease